MNISHNSSACLTMTLYLPSTPLNLFLSLVVAERRRVEYGEEAIMVLIDQPTRIIDDNNYLKLLRKLQFSPFQNVYILPNDSGYKGKIVRRKQNFDFLKELISKHCFNYIFVGNDRRIEFQYCMYQARKKKPSAMGVYLDDGLYTYIKEGTMFKNIIDCLEFRIKKLRYPWLTRVKTIGASELIHLSYIALPQLMLKSANSQRAITVIQSEWFMTSFIQNACSLACNIFACDGQKIMATDVFINLAHPHDINLIDDYKNKLHYRIKQYLAQGKHITVKYHPREEQIDRFELQALGDVYVVPHRLAMEFILPLFSANCLVISDRSTTFLTTKILRTDLSQLVLLKKSRKESPLENFVNSIGLVIEYW